jgi:hypothetical protein
MVVSRYCFSRLLLTALLRFKHCIGCEVYVLFACITVTVRLYLVECIQWKKWGFEGKVLGSMYLKGNDFVVYDSGNIV